MTTSIPDKDVRKLVARFPVEVSRTKRHLRICNPLTGKFVIASISGSDWRGLRNLEKNLRYLCRVADNGVLQAPLLR